MNIHRIGSQMQGAGLLLIFFLSFAITPVWAQSCPAAGEQKPPATAPSVTVTEGHDLSGATIPGRVIQLDSPAAGNMQRSSQTREFMSLDGTYQPAGESEQETVQIDPDTVRVVRRFYGRQPGEQRRLLQVNEEEKHRVPGGGEETVSTTSEFDVNGEFHVTRREILHSAPAGDDAQQTSATLLLPNANEGLGPAAKIEEVEHRSANGEVETHTSKIIPDGNGGWRTYQVNDVQIQNDNGVRTQEETVRQADIEGALLPAWATADRQWKDASGEEHGAMETYTTGLTGTTAYGDQELHLDRRVSVACRTIAGSRQMELEVERRNTLDATEPLKITSKDIEIFFGKGSGGTESRHVVLTLDNEQLRERLVFETHQQPNP